MKLTVFIPGIMGSELFLGDEKLWPPKVNETIGGYKRVDRLLDDAVVPGEIIEKVACFDVYEPILDFLARTEPDERFLAFPYDWRQDLEDTAGRLADTLDAVAGADEVRIVAHSMGGLVSRVLLESGAFEDRPWFARVTQLITLATPHKGAPQALVSILGIDGTMGLSPADAKRVTGDARYPSTYQLLPAPDDQGAWDVTSPAARLIDLYADGEAVLGLDPALLDRARWLHETIGPARRPPHVRYFAFVASGHDTTTRINLSGGDLSHTAGDDAGDGTVPMWSAAAGAVQKQVAAGEHSKFFRDEKVRFRIGDLLGRTPDMMARAQAMAAVTLRLSVNKPVFDRRDEWVEVLLVPNRPVETLEGELSLSRLGDDGSMTEVALEEVTYRGPKLTRLSVRMARPGEAGAYSLGFSGEPGLADRGGDAFSVREG